VRAMKAGAVEFLSKPFHDQDLLDAIHAAIERDRKRRREAVRFAELRERFATLSERDLCGREFGVSGASASDDDAHTAGGDDRIGGQMQRLPAPLHLSSRAPSRDRAIGFVLPR
jgi:GAF domain-containing protein